MRFDRSCVRHSIFRFRWLYQIGVPRLYGKLVGGKCVELQGASEALLAAYCCRIYINICCNNDSFVISLVTCKSVVSPITPLSILKLQLQGAVLLTKFISQVHEEFLHSLRGHPIIAGQIPWQHYTGIWRILFPKFLAYHAACHKDQLLVLYYSSYTLMICQWQLNVICSYTPIDMPSFPKQEC